MLKYPPGEEPGEEDFGGDIEKAEKVLFQRLVGYLRVRNPHTVISCLNADDLLFYLFLGQLFHEIDKKRDGEGALTSTPTLHLTLTRTGGHGGVDLRDANYY